ncbi:hypothetical protein [Pseudoduganella lutea]|uniref:Uncharacterized protein n=1 Tax=Pseudoduganella lutea TaxID=321985 RepID=A0A4P6L504_9BURK|nr:hypothetical protein [Pseudoduganella lutea]QBE65912.1 hypothetical protein EWM63_25435 [Pseudoduganella lutea]
MTDADVRSALQLLHLKEVTSLYPEYERHGLPSLLAELLRQTKDESQREEIEQKLAALVGRKIETGILCELNECAGTIVTDLMLPRRKSGAFYFFDCSKEAPFC